MSSDNVRYKISVPKFYYRRIKLWAYLEGTDRAGLSTDIIKKGLNDSWDAIDDRINQFAASEGMTREELENKVIGED